MNKNSAAKEREQIKKVLLTCLEEAGKIIRRGFGTSHRIQKKSPVSLVTETDTAAEKKIVSIIRKHFPDHPILTEESSPYPGMAPYRWIVDPLDGTTNYAHHLPLCCVSIGVETGGKVILGGVHNPLMNELYFAEAGKGAFLNGKKIQVSKVNRLLESLLVTGFPYDRQERAAFYLQFVQKMMEKGQGLRRLGAAALDLAYVASGRFEGYWEFNLKSWDMAAGLLIVEESGGKVTDFSGNPVNLDKPRQLLATNGKVHSELLSIFKEVIEGMDDLKLRIWEAHL